MQNFMDETFLLETECAKTLYRDYARPMPILDYHCHIHPKDIALNRRFANITELWLSGDHYKWRQMRANGVAEDYITGAAPDREKFQKWAETLEKLIGNPLYCWSHLELKRYFGYHGCLNGETAEEVWRLTCEKLKQPQMSAQGLIHQSRVTLLCTTDDPVDSLKWHIQIKNDDAFDTIVLPTFRPDKLLHAEAEDFADYIGELEIAAGIPILHLEDLKRAIQKRMRKFHEAGCRISDHGLYAMPYAPSSQEESDAIFQKALAGMLLTRKEAEQYKTDLLLFLGREYHRMGWAMQLHYGCRRNNCTSLYQTLGADAGFDCISNETATGPLIDFLNALFATGELPKTIVYSLNPNDNAAIDTAIGCFQNTEAAGALQHGSAWWFNDHKAGMLEHLTSLANLGVLGNFIGMLTDSRSFLSYTRHEYFRRILCNLIGGWVERGEYPNDAKALRQIIEGICYRNAVSYFGFDG